MFYVKLFDFFFNKCYNEFGTTMMMKLSQGWKTAALTFYYCVYLFLKGIKMKTYIYEVIKMANKARKKNEVPVGAIIALNGKIIVRAYNKKNKLKKVTSHAEIIAIEKASKKLHTWRLNDCVMYASMAPCMMCAGAIVESRIKKVYCLLKKENSCSIEWMRNNGVDVVFIEDDINSLMLLKIFFAKKR